MRNDLLDFQITKNENVCTRSVNLLPRVLSEVLEFMSVYDPQNLLFYEANIGYLMSFFYGYFEWIENGCPVLHCLSDTILSAPNKSLAHKIPQLDHYPTYLISFDSPVTCLMHNISTLMPSINLAKDGFYEIMLWGFTQKQKELRLPTESCFDLIQKDTISSLGQFMEGTKPLFTDLIFNQNYMLYFHFMVPKDGLVLSDSFLPFERAGDGMGSLEIQSFMEMEGFADLIKLALYLPFHDVGRLAKLNTSFQFEKQSKRMLDLYSYQGEF